MSTIIRGKNPRKPHTVRYWADGRQRERSFVTLTEARAFRTDADHAQRYGSPIDSKASRRDFASACECYIARLAGAPPTKVLYSGTLRTWIAPVLGSMTVAQVAGNRDAVAGLLTGTMAHLSLSRREAARAVIVGTLDEAVAAGTVSQHRAARIKLADNSRVDGRRDFVFPTHGQVEQVADAAGIVVWLMRGCGLRIQEALGVEKADFTDGGRTLRLAGQAALDGSQRTPLKHRRPGEGRDIPCPSWLWAMVEGMPDGPLCPGGGSRYARYGSVAGLFRRAAKAAGIPSGFTPHSLRHCFASSLLAAGVPLSDVAAWLGHRSIDETFGTYAHLVPSAAGRAASVLDAEWESWQAA